MCRPYRRLSSRSSTDHVRNTPVSWLRRQSLQYSLIRLLGRVGRDFELRCERPLMTFVSKSGMQVLAMEGSFSFLSFIYFSTVLFRLRKARIFYTYPLISVIVGFIQSCKRSASLALGLVIVDGKSRTPYDRVTDLPEASLIRVEIYRLAAQQHQELFLTRVSRASMRRLINVPEDEVYLDVNTRQECRFDALKFVLFLCVSSVSHVFMFT
ncbi:hypothetical protein KCU77_g82, partial [Aureobasidium melanogenum]